MTKPIFSGHETFRCKTHWLKRGYDFLSDKGSFTNEDAVVRLGVGKNMVSSIKYWMRSFGFLDENNTITDIAHYLLNDESGKDPYFEDIGTLWLMHFYLVNENHATIYNKTFLDYHKFRNDIEKDKLHHYLKGACFVDDYSNLYNKNTLKKDIDVLIHNYCGSGKDSIEEQNTLLLPLNLIKPSATKDIWLFNYVDQTNVPAEIFLFCIVAIKEMDSKSVSFELLQKLSLIFCMNNNDLISIIERVCLLYPAEIVFSDNSGIKELQFKTNFDKVEVLDNYYS